MAMASIKDIGVYLSTIRKNPDEIDLLAKDMLINVTRFFRDEETFERLAETVVPELMQPAAAGSRRSASGMPDAARARRLIRSPCCFSRRSHPRSET